MTAGCELVYGHRGAGKSLYAVDKAREFLERGCRVASNITLNLDHLMGPRNKATYTKLPGVVRPQDLYDLGYGYGDAGTKDYDESQFGLAIFDELGTFLNARDWNDKDRRAMFAWLTQSRKRKWKLLLLIQDPESMDAQIRRSLGDVYVTALSMDRVRIPFLPFRLPQARLYVGRYRSPQGPVSFRKVMRGNSLFKGYDTSEEIKPEELILEDGRVFDMRGCSSGLSAWHLVGRYLPPAPEPMLYAFFLLKWALVWPTLLAGRRRSRRLAGSAGPFQRDLSLLFPLLMPHVARDVFAQQQAIARARVDLLSKRLSAPQDANHGQNGIWGAGVLTPAETAPSAPAGDMSAPRLRLVKG